MKYSDFGYPLPEAEPVNQKEKNKKAKSKDKGKSKDIGKPKSKEAKPTKGTGFFGKLYVVFAGAESAQWVLLIILALGSAVGAYYYLRVAMMLFVWCTRCCVSPRESQIELAGQTASYASAPAWSSSEYGSSLHARSARPVARERSTSPNCRHHRAAASSRSRTRRQTWSIRPRRITGPLPSSLRRRGMRVG